MATLGGAVLLLALGGAAVVGAPAAEAPRRSVHYRMRTMGAMADVILVTADSARSAAQAGAAHAVLARVDSLMSNWTTTSEVARINRLPALTSHEVHPEVAVVIDASLRAWTQSQGAFDITVEPLVRLWGFLGGPKRVPSDPEIAAARRRVGSQRIGFDRATRTLLFGRDSMRIDLGGIAKGYAVDVAADSLRARGVTDALVDLTGNMRALGRPPGAEAWRIGIRDPRDRMPYFAKLTIQGEGISTSGKYEQFIAEGGRTYGHIIDPRTGWPAEGLISVTVIAATAFACDTWDTPLFVLGPEEARRLARARDDLAVVLVQPGNGVDTVWVESALRSRFTLEPAAAPLFHVIEF